MNKDRKKKFISAMLLYCLSGDLSIRVNYCGILISRIEKYLIDEVILKDANYAYLLRILKSVDAVVGNSLITKLQNSLSSQDLEEVKKIIVEKVFPIDESWSNQQATEGIESLGDLADIRTARYHYYQAANYYPASGNSANALSETIKSMDRTMQKIVDICEDYDLIEFEANQWRENIKTETE